MVELRAICTFGATMFVIRAVPTEALTSLRVETETNSVLVHTLLPEIPCGQEPSW